MSHPFSPNAAGIPDWDAMYREGTPPWESGLASQELEKILSEGLIPRGTALELGCGTGADAICLAKHGFDVTAVESAPTALERARYRAEMEDALLCFVLADVFHFCPKAGQFDLVYDAGFYHFIRQTELERFLDLLWRVTRPGSYYLTLAGAPDEAAEGGPPTVKEAEIRNELGRLFEFVHLRRFRFESPRRPEGYMGWSCLMKRPKFPK